MRQRVRCLEVHSSGNVAAIAPMVASSDASAVAAADELLAAVRGEGQSAEKNDGGRVRELALVR